jgi:hypothetical protein
MKKTTVTKFKTVPGKMMRSSDIIAFYQEGSFFHVILGHGEIIVMRVMNFNKRFRELLKNAVFVVVNDLVYIHSDNVKSMRCQEKKLHLDTNNTPSKNILIELNENIISIKQTGKEVLCI